MAFDAAVVVAAVAAVVVAVVAVVIATSVHVGPKAADVAEIPLAVFAIESASVGVEFGSSGNPAAMLGFGLTGEIVAWFHWILRILHRYILEFAVAVAAVGTGY